MVHTDRRWTVVLGIALLFMLFLFVNNTSMFSRRTEGSPVLLVHRGMSQRYTVPDRLDNCAASQMLPSQHDYLENTIRSMGRAFELGADIVEFDIHPTEDRQFAVFHDRLLECRTNGHGFTRAHRMAELQALDIGYGYTADHGKTFPFRGKGVGLMPSMDQVLSAFPDRSFLIDMKATEPEDGALLASHLLKLPQEQRSKLMVFGRDPVLENGSAAMPEIPCMDTPQRRAAALGLAESLYQSIRTARQFCDPDGRFSGERNFSGHGQRAGFDSNSCQLYRRDMDQRCNLVSGATGLTC